MINSTNLLTYFPALAGIGLILGFWTQSKNFVLKIFHIFWKQRSIPDRDLGNIFHKELYNKSKILNFDDFDIQNHTIFSIKNKKYLPAFFKLYKLEVFLYKGFIPIFVSGYNGGIKVSYLKYTFNFEKVFKKVIDEYYDFYSQEVSNKELSRFYIEEIRGRSLKSVAMARSENKDNTINVNVGQPSLESSSTSYYTLYPYGVKNNGLNNRLFNFDIKDVQWSDFNSQPKNKYIFTKKGEYILSQVSKWKNAKNFYEERNILYRRGMLLNGQTGSGKSSLVLEIAKTLGLPLFLVDLSTFENEEFCNKMDGLSQFPGIILFEDIDAIWDGRTNLIKTEHYGGITFDCFLNKLSGVRAVKNKFIFITTNHLEKMDLALIRAGRIDEVIDLPHLNTEEKYKMANIILDENKNLIEVAIKEGINDTTAEFENRMVQIAINNFWSKND